METIKLKQKNDGTRRLIIHGTIRTKIIPIRWSRIIRWNVKRTITRRKTIPTKRINGRINGRSKRSNAPTITDDYLKQIIIIITSNERISSCPRRIKIKHFGR
jgi:hypothetical protein